MFMAFLYGSLIERLVSVLFRYTNTTEATVKAALEGGTDLNCGGFYQSHAQVCFSPSKHNSLGCVQ